MTGVMGSTNSIRRVQNREDSAWPDHSETTIEVAYLQKGFAEAQVDDIKPLLALCAYITGSSHALNSPKLGQQPFDIPVYEFLSQGPRYVEFALRCLGQAHIHSSGPTPDRSFVHDFDFSL
jgi:hypothetical protein